MEDHYFGWTTDLNGDGTPETLRYYTEDWLPSEMDHGDGGREVRVYNSRDLNGRARTLLQTRVGKYDHRVGGLFHLIWELPDETFAAIARQDYGKGRMVSVRLDHRWRQCRVVSSGLADRKVTVAAGWVDIAGDTADLLVDTEFTCDPTDTYVYATNSSGAVALGGDTSVPAGAVQLATITIAGDVVTVTSDPSGAANARLCRIMGVTPTPVGGAIDRLEIVLQEER